MFCPHCHNKIPDGSNICPLCYANLAGLKSQPAPAQKDAQEPAEARVKKAPARKSTKKAAYTKGSRGSKKSADKTPMIIAFGLIMILVVIIAMIVKSMFGAGGDMTQRETQTPVVQQVKNTPEGNFIIFGETPTPAPRIEITATPAIEIIPTPAPTAEPTYKTLRKGDEGPEVVTLQQALTELGYLSGAADGNFGTGTQTAVKKFQEDNKLDADGIAGKMTQEALFKESSVTPIPDATVGPNDIMDLPG